jgi:hypothetical protein
MHERFGSAMGPMILAEASMTTREQLVSHCDKQLEDARKQVSAATHRRFLECLDRARRDVDVLSCFDKPLHEAMDRALERVPANPYGTTK